MNLEYLSITVYDSSTPRQDYKPGTMVSCSGCTCNSNPPIVGFKFCIYPFREREAGLLVGIGVDGWM